MLARLSRKTSRSCENIHGSGILNDMGTPRPNIFPKSSNIAYGWENHSGGAILGILGYS